MSNPKCIAFVAAYRLWDSCNDAFSPLVAWCVWCYMEQSRKQTERADSFSVVERASKLKPAQS